MTLFILKIFKEIARPINTPKARITQEKIHQSSASRYYWTNREKAFYKRISAFIVFLEIEWAISKILPEAITETLQLFVRHVESFLRNMIICFWYGIYNTYITKYTTTSTSEEHSTAMVPYSKHADSATRQHRFWCCSKFLRYYPNSDRETLTNLTLFQNTLHIVGNWWN